MKRLPRENRWKLSLHWDGPLVVKKRLSPPGVKEGNVYVIVDEEGTEHIRSAADLKMFVMPKDGQIFPPDRSPPEEVIVKETQSQPIATEDKQIDPVEFEMLYNDEEEQENTFVGELPNPVVVATFPAPVNPMQQVASQSDDESQTEDDATDDDDDDDDGERSHVTRNSGRPDDGGNEGLGGDDDVGGQRENAPDAEEPADDEADARSRRTNEEDSPEEFDSVRSSLSRELTLRPTHSTPIDKGGPQPNWEEGDTWDEELDRLHNLPSRNMLSRVEQRDLSTLFDDSDVTEAADLTPTRQEELEGAVGEDVRNFSTTARKGSSSNASPLGRPASRSAPGMSREVRNLGDHNTPGLRESKPEGRRRTRQNYMSQPDDTEQE